jgi:hypothetical protein
VRELDAALDTALAQRNDARRERDAALALVRRWSNFDFDCPDEYNDDMGQDEKDGWALNQLYEASAALLSKSRGEGG